MNVLAYNTKDGFSDPPRSADIVDFVVDQQPNVAFFSEAYAAKHATDPGLHSALNSFEKAGYFVLHYGYEDADGRLDSHGFVGITNLENTALNVKRYTTRNGLIATGYFDGSAQNFELYGLHANDRHEEGRMKQFAAIPQEGDRRIIIGDLNAMHGDTATARAVRMLGTVSRLLPSKEPGQKQNKIERMGSIGQRLYGMADGGSMAYLGSIGLRDADADRQPTMTLAGRTLFQLDHVMHTDDLVADPVHVFSDINLSDHKAISTSLALK